MQVLTVQEKGFFKNFISCQAGLPSHLSWLTGHAPIEVYRIYNTHHILQSLPNKISLELFITRVEKFHWYHIVGNAGLKIIKPVYSRKPLSQHFMAIALWLQKDSYFHYVSIGLDSASACLRTARTILFLPPPFTSTQINWCCVLSDFTPLHNLPNIIFTFVMNRILFKPDTMLISYSSNILWPFCTSEFQCMQSSKWIFKQTLFVIFAFPDSHWCSSFWYSRRELLGNLILESNVILFIIKENKTKKNQEKEEHIECAVK